MYYISALENNCALSVVKKRLGDFKGTEGEQYHVRTSRGLGERPVGRGLSRKSFCPWFVNRGACVATKGSQFLGDGLRPVVGAQFFADWG
jgi:hypothetical protein